MDQVNDYGDTIFNVRYIVDRAHFKTLIEIDRLITTATIVLLSAAYCVTLSVQGLTIIWSAMYLLGLAVVTITYRRRARANQTMIDLTSGVLADASDDTPEPPEFVERLHKRAEAMRSKRI